MTPLLIPLRPSSEHILIVRAPGARDQQGCHSILSSWGLAEQEGHLTASRRFFSILPENYAFNAFSTSSTWLSTLTLRKIAFNLPAWSMTKVLRSMPQYFLPYIFFSL